jgi:hemoglobin
MKTDITEREHIEILVNAFYDKVKQDEVIGFFFTDVVKVMWEKHLPTMYDFWDGVLFHSNKYTGNPMEKHLHINALSKMSMVHFQRWIQLFTATVDELYQGKNAEVIKQRAISIATVMQIKIFGS